VATAGINAIYCDLSSGSAAPSVEVQNLGFQTINGVTGAAAIYINYANHVGGGTCPGSRISNCWINAQLTSGGGFVDGFVVNNSYDTIIDNESCDGNHSTYDSGSGGSSGAFIKLIGSTVNNTISNIDAAFWAKAISVVAAGTDLFQGINITNVITVQTPNAIYLNGANGSAAVEISNILLDNGNIPAQSVAYCLWVNDVIGVVCDNGIVLSNSASATPAIFIAGSVASKIANIQVSQSSATAGVALSGCDSCTVENITFGTMSAPEVTLDASCSYCYVTKCNKYGGPYIQPTDAGTGNVVGDTRSFTIVPTLIGGSATETVYLDVRACSLAHKPNGASVRVSSSVTIDCQYNWDDASNSKSQIACRFFRYDGAALPAGAIRISAVVAP
jgi:hypothetical protein